MNQVALITGGTRGIGLGISRELAMKGFNLALNGMRPLEQVRDVVAELQKNGTEVIYCQGNIASTPDRKEIWKQIMDYYGRLNLLVNNAGIGPRKRLDILQTTEKSYHEVMNVNLTGPYFLTQHAANLMVNQKQKDPDFKAAIINISSISATLASVNRGEYCLSKAGMSILCYDFVLHPRYSTANGSPDIILQSDFTKVTSL